MNPLLSIVVPIYNVEEYLSNCIDSILNQTFNDFELILVNDGSTDNSLDICYTYAKIDKRIKVINKKNGGVSSARNVGIDKAIGKYIAFVDSDDDIESNMYFELISRINDNNVDMVICSLKYIDLINKTNTKQVVWNRVESIIPKEEIEKEIFKRILNFEEGYGIYTPVNKIYKRELFDKFSIRFDESRHHGEDARLNLVLLTKVKKIYFVDKAFYNYYIRKRESLTRTIREDLYDYILDNNNFHKKLCDMYGYYEQKTIGTKHYLNETMKYMISVSESDLNFNKRISILNSIMNDKEFVKNINNYVVPYRYYKLLKFSSINKNSILFVFLIKLLNLKTRILG